MNLRVRSLFASKLLLFSWVCSFSLSSLASAQNQGGRLTDGSAVFDYAFAGTGQLPTVPQGATGNVPWNLQIDGTPGDPTKQQLFSGNWFYRVLGDNRERHFANAAVRLNPTPDYLYYRIDQIAGGPSPARVQDLWAEMDFVVYDTGPYSCLLSIQVCFHNDGDTTIDIEVFLAVDFHLDADSQTDVVSGLTGGNLWTLSDGLVNGIMYGPGAVGAAADEQSFIMNQMTGTGISNFTGGHNTGLGLYNDTATLLQFHITLPGRTMFCTPAFIGIGVGMMPPLFIPEPGSLALLMIGGVVAFTRRTTPL